MDMGKKNTKTWRKKIVNMFKTITVESQLFYCNYFGLKDYE